MPGAKYSGSATPPARRRGISTSQDLMERCIVDDFTGCWHWQGAMRTDRNGQRTPAIWVFDTVKDKFRTMTGPIAVLELTQRRLIGVKMAWRTCRCDDCVNPEHVAGGTRKDWGRWLRATGVWKNVPARIVANRKSSRARTDTTRELVQAVRESPLNGLQAAAEFGLKAKHVSQIRTRKVWADRVAAGASVFSLGAR